MVDKSEIEFYILLYTRIGEAIGNSYSVSVAFSGDPSHVVKVVLMIGILHMGKKLGSFSCKMISSSKADLSWISFQMDRHRP